MTSAEQYRNIAAKLMANAAREHSEHIAAEWNNLALSYLRLAEQAEANSFSDVWIEIGPQPTLKSERA